MSSKTKVLVIFAEEDQEREWTKTGKPVPKEGYSYTMTNFNKFTDGARHNNFDMVLVYAPTSAQDDFEMQEELFNYYTVAPVVAVINSQPAEFFTSKFGNGTIVVAPGSDDETDLVAIDGALSQAKAYYDKLLNEDVRQGFTKYDADGSNALERAEIGKLMRDLGSELTEDQITAAFKDLDLNKDGVIDYDEFVRWYFTGMKSYSGVQRTFLKVSARSAKLFEAIKEQTSLALLKEEIKYKKNHVQVTFNAPENPQTTMSVKVNFGGSDNEKLATTLWERYDATSQLELENKYKRGQAEGWSHLYMEAKISVDAGTAAGHVETLNNRLAEATAFMAAKEDDFFPRPKAILIDDSTVAVGVRFPFEQWRKAKEGMVQFREVLNAAGQHVHFDYELGTSLEEIMSGNEPIATLLAKGGFRARAGLCLISNVNRVLQEFARSADEKTEALFRKVFMITPVFMFAVQASVDLQFDDFEQVESHPFAAPFLVSFAQLFEGQFGSQDDILEATLPDSHEREDTAQLLKIWHDVRAVVGNLSNEITLSVASPDHLLSSEIRLSAPGVRRAAQLALGLTAMNVQEEI